MGFEILLGEGSKVTARATNQGWHFICHDARGAEVDLSVVAGHHQMSTRQFKVALISLLDKGCGQPTKTSFSDFLGELPEGPERRLMQLLFR